LTAQELGQEVSSRLIESRTTTITHITTQSDSEARQTTFPLLRGPQTSLSHCHFRIFAWPASVAWYEAYTALLRTLSWLCHQRPGSSFGSMRLFSVSDCNGRFQPTRYSKLPGIGICIIIHACHHGLFPEISLSFVRTNLARTSTCCLDAAIHGSYSVT
jgi:hypothetical protein